MGKDVKEEKVFLSAFFCAQTIPLKQTAEIKAN
jgi:hypothetical protein